MDERRFVDERKPDWDRLAAIVARAWSRAGLRSLAREDVRALGPLYRRAASDLARARSQAAGPDLVAHLNQLVARSHALLYQTDSRSWAGVVGFFARDFPATFRRRLGFFLAAALLLLAGAAVGYGLVAHDRANIDVFVPPQSPLRPSLEHWQSGKVTGDIPDAVGARAASQLMTHNLTVSFLAFALGIVGGFLTAFLMFYNGAMLGAFAGVVTHAHQHASFWPGIVPHGVVELSETCMAGAAGLALGWALLAPGPWRRRDALVLAALDSVKLIVGGVALLVFAGLVEAFISHSVLPGPVRVGFGVLSAAALYSYLALAGRSPQGSPTEGTAPSPRGSG